jgi:outer membrane protein assembly factor BamB
MKILRFIVMLVSLSLLLSACAGGGTTGLAPSWPGVTVDAQGGTVYVAYNNYLHAINLANGSEKWHYPKERDSKQSYYAAATVAQDGQVLVGGYDHVFYSLKPEAGDQNWNFPGATDRYVASAVVEGEDVYAPNSDGMLYALDLAGRSRWQFDTGNSLWAAVAVNGEKVYVASMDHCLYALDASTGSQVWKTEDLGGAIVNKPALSDAGVLYVGTVGREMIAINATDGKVQWRFTTDGWAWSTPLLANDTLYFGTLGGVVYALSATDGSPRWQIEPDQTVKGQITGTPLLRGDTLYFANKAGVLYAVDTATGGPRWNKTIGGEIYNDLVGTEDMIFVAPVKFDSILVALNLDGNQVWAFVPPK